MTRLRQGFVEVISPELDYGKRFLWVEREESKGG